MKRNYRRYKQLWRRLRKYYRVVPHGRYLANFSVDRAKLFAIVNSMYEPGTFQWAYLVGLIIGSPLLTSTMFNEAVRLVKAGDITYNKLRRNNAPMFTLVKFLMLLWNVPPYAHILDNLPKEHKKLKEITEEINEKFEKRFMPAEIRQECKDTFTSTDSF